MKKRYTGILAMVLSCSVLAACGGSASAANKAEKSTELVIPQEVTASAAASGVQADEVLITLSDKGSTASDSSVSISGSTVTITQEGTYRVTGTLSDGQIVVKADDAAKVKIILDGADISCKGSAAIYAVSADKLVLASAADSVSSLSSVGAYVQTDDNTVDAAVFAKCDLNLNGDGTVLIQSEQGHGVVSKDDLKLKSGTWSVTAQSKGLSGKDSLTAEGGELVVTCGGKGLSSGNDEDETKGSIEIQGGVLSITSDDDAIHADNSVTVSGGTLTLSSGDDGIHADSVLDISGGTVTILKSYEGLEAEEIILSGGDIELTASDDGVNAAGGNDGSNSFGPFGGDPFGGGSGSLTISGGTLVVDAGGDGLDSNGDLTVTGGAVYISGPTDNGNGALDYNGSAVITGGTVFAAGSSGMAENFGSGSTQGSILLNVGNQAAGTTVIITDENGKELASFTPTKSFSSVVISTGGMQQGGTYGVVIGKEVQTVTLTDVIYGSGMGGMMGGMHGQKGGQTDGMQLPEGFEPPEGMELPEGMEFPNGTGRPGGGSGKMGFPGGKGGQSGFPGAFDGGNGQSDTARS